MVLYHVLDTVHINLLILDEGQVIANTKSTIRHKHIRQSIIVYWSNSAQRLGDSQWKIYEDVLKQGSLSFIWMCTRAWRYQMDVNKKTPKINSWVFRTLTVECFILLWPILNMVKRQLMPNLQHVDRDSNKNYHILAFFYIAMKGDGWYKEGREIITYSIIFKLFCVIFR